MAALVGPPQTSGETPPLVSTLLPRRQRRLPLRFALRWFFAWIIIIAAQQGLAQSFNEYQIKAVFLFNFAQFVEWPSQPAPHAPAPFVIGVLGDDPFNGFLDDTVRGETINNRPFVVHRYRRSEDIADCDILFVSHSEMDRLQKILSELKGRNVLTVSDTDNFARDGGMVQFVTENKRVHLKINVAAARAANITISSKLLRPAEIVPSDSG